MSSLTLSTRLRISAAIIGGFGVLTALAALPALSGLIHLFVDIVTWPRNGAGGLVTPEGRLVLAIAGGITCGWAVTLWQLSGAALRAAPRAVVGAAMTGFTAWLILDSTASVMAGAPLNIVGNLAFYAVLVAPLLPALRTDAART
ncbi:hypothetical protein [Jannaschia pohangensis]|uniref:Uncharacterized protein n=1 Tax=Jannaschia pohangensis TaxID=390807 RepID=A0A1I3GM17_9RHOB|nr:hypothetical protein [Jannaschia pohangensis]SFI24484.1 hypothetical protein SAMN04488095_0249 [Jannaschia pohangensis]